MIQRPRFFKCEPVGRLGVASITREPIRRGHAEFFGLTSLPLKIARRSGHGRQVSRIEKREDRLAGALLELDVEKDGHRVALQFDAGAGPALSCARLA